jgi:peptide-methionine (S)-S-oxide reductase
MNPLVKVATVVSLAATAGASPARAAQSETAVLAGGCFWGMEAVFEHVKGVDNVVAGYAGGSADKADYDDVSSERTGHAEAVRISYDPSKISYYDLLKIYFTVAHDPTELNRQGPDVGPSYRSAIFPQNAKQRALAEKAIRLIRAHGKDIVTKIESGGFYTAEGYHQDYVRKHPHAGYVVVNDLPKLAKLKRDDPEWWTA